METHTHTLTVCVENFLYFHFGLNVMRHPRRQYLEFSELSQTHTHTHRHRLTGSISVCFALGKRNGKKGFKLPSYERTNVILVSFSVMVAYHHHKSGGGNLYIKRARAPNSPIFGMDGWMLDRDSELAKTSIYAWHPVVATKGDC